MVSLLTSRLVATLPLLFPHLRPGSSAGAQKVYKSADGGATWTKLDLPGVPADHPVVSLLGIDPQGGHYVWVLAQASLIRSQDGGATWSALPTIGLPSGVTALAIDPQNPDHLFAGTGGADVFEITLSPAQQ
jgi:hypothetical protein